jgi:hypothetical protein
VPSKAFCAAASIGIINRAPSATEKKNFFIANLPRFEPRAKLYQNWS